MKRYSFKKLGAMLALAGLAIRLAVAFLHVPTALAADIAAASQNSGNFILVYCTVHGTMKVPADFFDTANTTGGEPNGPADPTDQPSAIDPPLCPICQAVSIADAGIDTRGLATLKAPTLSREKLASARTYIAPRSNIIRLSARGPPRARLS